MRVLFNWLSVISVVILTTTILMQSRGQSLGISFGGDSNSYHTRRGAEKVLYNVTIVASVVFVLSVLLGILSKS